MKKISIILSSIFVLFAFTSSIFAKPAYIDIKPLKQVVKTPVGPLKYNNTLEVPIITWGGDIATIYANGNSRTTADKSIFSDAGLRIKLSRVDNFTDQLSSYLSGKSPFLRCTVGMCSQAMELLNQNQATKPVFIYQLTWSAGGDALVVKENIKTTKDLKGKTIAVQAYGPHVDYLTKVLSDAGLNLKDVKIKWLPDLTGTDNSPMAAFYESDIDAAFVIIPDALALSSNGTVGTGAEDSVKGAQILMSTKTANRIIADVYAVRSDFYKSNRSEVDAFVHSLFKAQEKIAAIMSGTGSDKTKLLESSADILLDAKEAAADAEGLYLDAEFAGYQGNIKFFQNSKYPRNINKLSSEAQASFKTIGLIGQTAAIVSADFDYKKLEAGLLNTAKVEQPKFDKTQVAAVVSRKQQQGTLGNDELFSFEVFFKPNQNEFSADLYADSFQKVIEFASTYGGALITVEGHSDPMGYLRKRKANAPDVVLSRIKQSAKNLSLSRAVKVREEIIKFAENSGVALDESQFATIGHGINQPSTGICGSIPCAPKTEQEWLSNMRVQFRIIQVEAESSVFKPL